MREQFEKLPVIDKILKGKKLRWDNKTKCYTGLDGKYCDDANHVNLAWYAFQEQQKKIDGLINAVSEHSMYDKVSGSKIIFVDEVKELLK